MNKEQVATADLKTLTAFYNANCGPADLGPVKRFADVTAARRRVTALLGLMPKSAAPTPVARPVPAPVAAPFANVTRSAAVAETWRDPAVRAVRSERHCVRVDGEEYRSVRAAFLALGLDLKKHVVFRANLKKAGSTQAFGHAWVAVQTN